MPKSNAVAALLQSLSWATLTLDLSPEQAEADLARIVQASIANVIRNLGGDVLRRPALDIISALNHDLPSEMMRQIEFHYKNPPTSDR